MSESWIITLVYNPRARDCLEMRLDLQREISSLPGLVAGRLRYRSFQIEAWWLAQGFSGQEYQNFEPNISRFSCGLFSSSTHAIWAAYLVLSTAFPLLLEKKYLPVKC